VILGMANHEFIRRAAPSDRDEAYDPTTGRPVELDETTLTLRASVQPMGEKQAAYLPVGVRMADAKFVMTAAPLYPANEATGALADLLVLGDEVYEVRDVWAVTAVLPHYEAIVVRVEREDPDA
jgi:hypothetical protein